MAQRTGKIDPFLCDVFSLGATFLLVVLKISEDDIRGYNQKNKDLMLLRKLSNNKNCEMSLNLCVAKMTKYEDTERASKEELYEWTKDC